MSSHSEHSVLRENILEHLLIGEILKRLWQRGIFDVEILRSEFDTGGYDLMLSRGKSVRHIQLKSKRAEGRTREVSIGLKLAERPAGCIICIEIDDDLEVTGYLWFGGRSAEPLPSIESFPVARHNKANSEGIKSERKAHRKLPFSKFERLDTIDQVLDRLLT